MKQIYGRLTFLRRRYARFRELSNSSIAGGFAFPLLFIKFAQKGGEIIVTELSAQHVEYQRTFIGNRSKGTRRNTGPGALPARLDVRIFIHQRADREILESLVQAGDAVGLLRVQASA